MENSGFICAVLIVYQVFRSSTITASRIFVVGVVPIEGLREVASNSEGTSDSVEGGEPQSVTGDSSRSSGTRAQVTTSSGRSAHPVFFRIFALFFA